ncbi:MAG: hypothetical protein QM723_40580 [Myxococcaceae bacterium]
MDLHRIDINGNVSLRATAFKTGDGPLLTLPENARPKTRQIFSGVADLDGVSNPTTVFVEPNGDVTAPHAPRGAEVHLWQVLFNPAD